MSASYEIKKLSKKVYNARIDVNSENKTLQSEMNQIMYWWKGSAASAFVNKCGETSIDIERICRNLEDLHLKMKKLASALERAEDEQRAAASKARD